MNQVAIKMYFQSVNKCFCQSDHDTIPRMSFDAVLLFLFLAVNSVLSQSLRQSFPWDEDYAELETSTTTKSPFPSSTTHASDDDEQFPWDEDYADNTIRTTATFRPRPTRTTPRPLPITTARSTTTAPQSGPFPWEDDYPDPVTGPAATVTRPSTQRTTGREDSTESATTQTSGPYPWEDDYPDNTAGSATTTVRTTTRPQTAGTFPWEDDYEEAGSPSAAGLAPTHRPQTTPGHRPAVVATTTTQSSATFIYFPAPMEPPLLAASFNASLLANLPCNEGSFFERFQCLGQYMLSFG